MSLLSSMTRIRMARGYSRTADSDERKGNATLRLPRLRRVPILRTRMACGAEKARAIKRPKEVSLGEHTSLGPKATAPITVICLSPDLTLGVSSRTYSGTDTSQTPIKFVLSLTLPFVNKQVDEMVDYFRFNGIDRQICEPIT